MQVLLPVQLISILVYVSGRSTVAQPYVVLSPDLAPSHIYSIPDTPVDKKNILGSELSLNKRRDYLLPCTV